MARRDVGGRRVALALLFTVVAAGPGALGASSKATAPVPATILAVMAARDVAPSAPVLMRAYKKEGELEVWKRNRQGRFVLVRTFPICRWSGQLGPKQRTGDRQVPEGFYTVAPRQMNPNSAYHLSFDIGYPNAFDRAHGATGSAIMVHGICSSAGCLAMTNGQVSEIYALARDAFAGGQAAFQFHSFPFRMTAHNMARHRTDPNMPFWRQLKEGSDRFEATGAEPAISVVGGRYSVAPFADGIIETVALARRADETARVAALVADGVAAVRTTYSDGGQNPAFAALARRGVSLGDVSRPEALAAAGQEIVVIAARPRRPAALAATTVGVPPNAPSQPASIVVREIDLFGPAPLASPDAGHRGAADIPGAVGTVPGTLVVATLAR